MNTRFFYADANGALVRDMVITAGSLSELVQVVDLNRPEGCIAVEAHDGEQQETHRFDHDQRKIVPIASLTLEGS